MAVSPETRRGRWIPRIKLYRIKSETSILSKKRKRKGQARKLLRSCPSFYDRYCSTIGKRPFAHCTAMTVLLLPFYYQRNGIKRDSAGKVVAYEKTLFKKVRIYSKKSAKQAAFCGKMCFHYTIDEPQLSVLLCQITIASRLLEQLLPILLDNFAPVWYTTIKVATFASQVRGGLDGSA